MQGLKVKVEEGKNGKEYDFQIRHVRMIKRTDMKRLQRRMHIERREILEEAKLLSEEETLRRKQTVEEDDFTENWFPFKDEICKIEKIDQSKPSIYNHGKTQSQLLEEKIHIEDKQVKLLTHLYRNDSFDKIKLIEAEEKKRNYKRDLKNQIMCNSKEHREKTLEEKNHERFILNEAMGIIRNENNEAMKQKREIEAHVRAEKQAYFDMQKLWEDKRKVALQNEENRIARIILEKERKQKERFEKKVDTSAAKDLLLEKMSRRKLDDDCKKQEQEDAINELYLEEEEVKRVNESVMRALKRKSIARDMANEMVRLQKSFHDKKAEAKAIEDVFARYLDEELKEFDKKEKQKEMEMHEKNLHYGKDLRDAITNNRIQYAIRMLCGK